MRGQLLRVTFRGKDELFSDLCTRHGIPWHTAYQRLHRGWSLEEVFTTPVQRWKAAPAPAAAPAADSQPTESRAHATIGRCWCGRWHKKEGSWRAREEMRRIEFRGKQELLSDLCERFAIKADVVKKRLTLGWDPERALTESVEKRSPQRKVIEPRVPAAAVDTKLTEATRAETAMPWEQHPVPWDNVAGAKKPANGCSPAARSPRELPEPRLIPKRTYPVQPRGTGAALAAARQLIVEFEEACRTVKTLERRRERLLERINAWQAAHGGVG